MCIFHRKNDSTEAFSVYFEKLTSLQYKVIRAINGTFKLMLSFFKGLMAVCIPKLPLHRV